MKPSILIIIMDFLVSSLLLLVSSPVERQEFVTSYEISHTAESSEFSLEAVQEMEVQWNKDYQEKARIAQLFSQGSLIKEERERSQELARMNSELGESVTRKEWLIGKQQLALNERDAQIKETLKARDELSAANEEMKQTISRQEKMIEEKSGAVESKSKEITALKETKEQKELLLAQVENKASLLEAEKASLTSDLREREKALLSQQETIAKLSQSNEQLKELSKKQQAIETLTTDISSKISDVQQGQKETKTLAVDIKKDQEQISSKISDVQQGQVKTQTKLDEMAQGQALIAQRVETINRNQVEMKATVNSLEKFSERLPEEIRKESERVISSQNRMQDNLSSFGELLSRVSDEMSTEERTALSDRVGQLLAQQQELQKRMQSIIENNVNQERTVERIGELGKEQAAMNEGLKDLGGKLEDVEARRSNHFLAFRDARIELMVTIKEKDLGAISWINPDDIKQIETYPPVLQTKDGPLIAMSSYDLGLDWSEISSDGDVYEFSMVVAKRGDNPFSLNLKSPILISSGDMKIALLQMRSAEGSGFDSMKPMRLVGRQALERRGTKDLYLFKRTSQGLSFGVEASFDLKDSNCLMLKTPSGLSDKLLNAFSSKNSAPERGDFIITSEGEMVGILTDTDRCHILDETSISSTSRIIPTDNLQSFVQEIKRYQQDVKGR